MGYKMTTRSFQQTGISDVFVLFESTCLLVDPGTLPSTRIFVHVVDTVLRDLRTLFFGESRTAKPVVEVVILILFARI